MNKSKNTLSPTRVVLATAICAAWIFGVFSFAGTGSNQAFGAVLLGFAAYEADMGRYPVRRSVYGSTGGTTFPQASVQTEIVSMSLTGSPTGGTVALPDIGTEFIVDSFFDVITELSVDGGSFNIDSFFDITLLVNNTGSGKISPDRPPTGSWDTEIVSMSLSGDVPGLGPIVVRESPSLSSLGQHSLTDNNDGTFLVDSFFDVFTEISVDGGAFIPAAESMRLDIVGIAPEPSSAILGIMGLLGLVNMARRRPRGCPVEILPGNIDTRRFHGSGANH